MTLLAVCCVIGLLACLRGDMLSAGSGKSNLRSGLDRNPRELIRREHVSIFSIGPQMKRLLNPYWHQSSTGTIRMIPRTVCLCWNVAHVIFHAVDVRFLFLLLHLLWVMPLFCWCAFLYKTPCIFHRGWPFDLRFCIPNQLISAYLERGENTLSCHREREANCKHWQH